MADEKKLTEEQQKILDTGAKRVVISASAGSGKTFVLTTKLIDIIVNKKIKLDRLLVLTFTKVAANEIKTRLTNAILSLSPTKDLLASIDLLPLSDISTIDSFCEKIIKRNISKLELDENFVIIDEKSAKKYKKMAFLSTFQHFAGKNQEIFNEIYLAFKRNKETLEECIYSIQDFLSSQVEENFLEKFKEEYDEKNALAKSDLISFIKEKIKLAKLELQCINPLDLSKAEEKIFATFESFLNLNTDCDFFEICKNVNNLSLPALRGKLDEDIKKRFSKAKEELGEIKELAEIYSAISEKLLEKNKSGVLSKALIDFYLYYEEVYNGLKQKRSALDFADIEKICKKLLEDDEIKGDLAKRYDYIFIDEYQDTNRVQESILKPIASEGYFIAVGDIKQGIYGFRNASMEIMLDDINEFSSSSDGEALILNGNFRTINSILSFVNQIFQKLMTKESVGIDYTGTSMLKGLNKFEPNGQPSVIVDIVTNSAEEKEEGGEKIIYSVAEDELSGDKELASEVDAIVNRVAKVMDSQIYDTKLKRMREVEPNDIALLFRGRSPLMKETVKALRHNGLLVEADLKESLLEDSQISVLCSLLKLTLNFHDDYSLASCLTSIFGEMSIEQLGNLRANHEGKKCFYEIIEECEDEKITKFKSLIEKFKFEIQIFGIFKALSRLFNEYDYYSYLASFEDGREKLGKVNLLFRLIREGGLEYNVAGVISMLESSLVSGNDGRGNAISVLTIHSTKGLEYPIVILCDGGTNLKKVYNKNFVITNKYGLGVYLNDFEKMVRVQSPLFVAGRKYQMAKEFIDEIMIFYVALTRPQNQLIIIGKGNQRDFTFDDLYSQNSYLKFILYAFGENFARKLFEEGNISTENWQFNIVTQEEIKVIDEEKIEVKECASARFENEIKLFNEFTYENEANCKLSLKNSVTGVTKHSNEEFESKAESEAMTEEQLLSRERAITRGNAYHEALKLINFDNINNLNELQKEIEIIAPRMTEGYLEELDLDLLLKNILLIKSVIGKNRALKEKEFIMSVGAKELGLSDGELANNMIVQGIVDLFAVGEKLILIDYKYTSCNDDRILKERYLGQLKLYKQALTNALGRNVDEIYLLSLKHGKLIEVSEV